MKVKKRNGNLENFNLEKIQTSLINSSLEKDPLNEGDIRILMKTIVKKFTNYPKEIVPVEEIFNVIYSTLKECGFPQTAEEYKTGTGR